MTTRIDITPTPHGSNILAAVSQLREARDKLEHAKAVMETCIDAGDYTKLEQVFGAPGGTGETLYNLIAGDVSDLAGYNISATIARIG